MINNDINIKVDCFAYNNGNCTCLTELVCSKKKCSFYKKLDEVDIDNINKSIIDYSDKTTKKL